jgi:ribosomal protein S18 acetylase RimI-like enzyme
VHKLQVEIDDAGLDDVRGVAQAHVASWAAAYKDILPLAAIAAQTVDRRMAAWKQILLDGSTQLCVARAAGEIVGFVSFGASRDDAAPAETAEILALYVRPAQWSQGIGKALWTEALGRLREQGFSRVTLWVLERNRRARDFYKAQGCSADSESVRTIERGGSTLNEIRCGMAI